jgi:hypothetical protein
MAFAPSDLDDLGGLRFLQLQESTSKYLQFRIVASIFNENANILNKVHQMQI